MIGVTKMRTPARFGSFVYACWVLAVAPTLLAQPAGLSWTTVAPGVEHAHFRREAPAEGSWNVNVLRVDMSHARLDVIRARDTAIGLETVTSIATRLGAVAATNGGYFRTSGDFLGDSTGTLQIDRVVWSEPDRARAAVGIVRERRSSRLIFGHVVWQASIEAGREKRPVEGLNRARGPNDLVVFTPEFGPATITDDSGIEVVVRSGRVVDVLDSTGGTTIPRDGFIVSARGEARDWVRRSMAKGTRVRIRTTLQPADPARSNPWAAAEDILGAGPKLVTAGRVDVTDVREKMIPTFATDLHPRTAIGALADGRALLLVADGRRAPERVGLALDDLAKLLIELGAIEAINLDGGGSTTMVVRGKVMNFPSDPTGERPVSDAIVVRGPS
jgi:exopolysaccharide biosynthesis protein